MKFKITLATFLLLALSAPAQSVRDVSDASMDPSIIMPESSEVNTREMLENWYLQRYTVIDTEADSKSSGDLSDAVITERLSRLPVTIEMPFNTPVRNAIHYYVRKKQLVENMLGLSIYYMPIFEEALERYGLPRELKYLPVIESALRPDAKSKAGAGGLWQFMPATGSGHGLEQNSLVDQRFDPYASSEAGARYLKELYNSFGDWSLAIASYNCGPGNVNKALRRAGEGKHDFWDIYPFLPAETRGYFPAFIAANYIMTYHKNHNISPALARRPLVVDTVHVNRRVHLQQISDVMDIPMSELRALNPQYIRDIIPGDIKPYPLTLPSLQAYAYIANEDSVVNHNASRYARRGVVEPASGNITGRDSRGEYYDEEIIQWHTVRRGETLSKIARRYGTTVGAIRRTNRCGRSVQAGRKLKIKTVTRRYRPAPQPEPVEEQNNGQNTLPEMTPAVPAAGDSVSMNRADSLAMPGDSIIVPGDDNHSREVADAFTSDAPAPAIAHHESNNESNPVHQQEVQRNTNRRNENANRPNNSVTQRPAATKRHTVRRGESLSRIARRYGVTVKAIKRANNLRNDNIQAGQRLIIPAK